MKRLAMLAGFIGGAAIGADIAWRWDDSRHVDSAPVTAVASLAGTGTGSVAQEGSIVKADGTFSSYSYDWDDSNWFRLDTFKRTGVTIIIR